MDLVSGLSAAKLAINLAEELRSIDRSVGEATSKLKFADLSIALADAQMASSDAKRMRIELEVASRNLRDGTLYPVCRVGRLKGVKITPYSFYTVEFRNCARGNPSFRDATTRTSDSTQALYTSKNE